MKKLTCILLTVVLLFLMVGCAQKGTFNEYTYDGMFITPRPIYAETKEEIEELAKHERAPQRSAHDEERVGNRNDEGQDCISK